MFDQNSFNSIFLLKQLISQKTKPLWSDAANKSVILKKKKTFQKTHTFVYRVVIFISFCAIVVANTNASWLIHRHTAKY